MKTGTENKFAAILQARQSPAVMEEEPIAATPKPTRNPVAPIVTASASVVPSRQVGRPGGKGKKSNPSFRQVTAYFPKDLHNNATIALRLANQERVDADKEDFSELLTRLLANWYENQAYYRPTK
jgi:hypothetical protein